MRLDPYKGEAPSEDVDEGYDVLLERADLREVVAEIHGEPVRKYNEDQERDSHGRFATMYHGTNADLVPGDVIEIGHEAQHGRDNDKVWVADNAWDASKYGSKTYEVRPVGDVKARGKAHEFHTTAAEVVREVDKHEILDAANKIAHDEMGVPLPPLPGERSGAPEIDTAIEAFMKEPLGDWTTDDGTIEDLRDPAMAHGSCAEVTEQFVDFAKDRGLKAYVTDTNTEEMGYTPTGEAHGEVLNDEGEIVTGFYNEHTVAEIYLPHQAWPVTIDFTASQYGYKDFPKVQN